MKRDRTQRKLDQLRAIRYALRAPGADAILAEAVEDSSNYVVGKAAALIEEASLTGLAANLAAAFDRLIGNASKLDKGCEALTAIAKALYALDHHIPELYLRGARHHQWEGAAPATDMAQPLRAICALGLSQTRHPEVLDELVRLLTDDSARVRANAARAIGCLGNAEVCIPLLKLKLYTGDKELDVLAECMTAMLNISVSRCIQPVLDQLDNLDSTRAEAAAFALGSIRDDRAFDALQDKWNRTVTGPVRERILRAMSLSRTEKGLQFLAGLMADAPPRTAVLAAKALLEHRHDPRILGMVQNVGGIRAEIAEVLGLV